jgi:hypothetical protein
MIKGAISSLKTKEEIIAKDILWMVVLMQAD